MLKIFSRPARFLMLVTVIALLAASCAPAVAPETEAPAAVEEETPVEETTTEEVEV